MKNYTDETFLKGFVPALTKYLWTGETTYNAQKEKAELIVRNDFIARGYNIAFIQVPLYLRESSVLSATETTDSVEDEVMRLRYVYTVPTYSVTSTKTIALQGSNDDDTFETIQTFTPTAVTTTDVTGYIADVFKYYRLVITLTSGTIDVTFKLIESSYDLFYAYKWLELIMMDAFKSENDMYYLKMLEFRNLYNDLWNKIKINEDTNEDGNLDDTESYTHITFAP